MRAAHQVGELAGRCGEAESRRKRRRWEEDRQTDRETLDKERQRGGKEEGEGAGGKTGVREIVSGSERAGTDWQPQLV